MRVMNVRVLSAVGPVKLLLPAVGVGFTCSAHARYGTNVNSKLTGEDYLLICVSRQHD